MSVTTPTVFAIRRSLDSDILGLDNSEAPTNLGYPKGLYTPYLTGNGLRGIRLFYPGQYGLQGNDYKECVRISHNDIFDDFLGFNINDIIWNLVHGTDGTAAAPAIHAANNGTARLTSGNGATHTMAVNGSQMVSQLNMLVSDSATLFEARLGNASALTSQSICFGLVDSSSLSAPFTRATTTTTANATNAACFLQDSASTNTHLYAVSVNAGGTPVSIALNVDISTTAYNVYRIEIDAAGNTYFFINGVLVATQLLAVATTAVLAPSVGMFSNATSASQTLDVDYVLTQSLRV